MKKILIFIGLCLVLKGFGQMSSDEIPITVDTSRWSDSSHFASDANTLETHPASYFASQTEQNADSVALNTERTAKNDSVAAIRNTAYQTAANVTATISARKINATDSATNSIQGFMTAYDHQMLTYASAVSGLTFDSIRFNHSISVANNYTVTAAKTIQLSYLPKTYGSVYIVDFIGDGNATHILTYTNCIVDDNAVVYDYTLNKHNLHTFIYLPGGVWYSNKVK